MAVSARVRSLQTRLAEATTGELETKALLRKARRQAQRSNKNRCWRQDTATTIMIMQNGQFDAALRYCDQEGLDLFESRKRLEQELLDGNMEDMVARLHPRTPYEKKLVARAEKFCAEYQLATWVEARSEGEGVAPAYQHVFAHMKQVQPVTVAAASRSRLLKYRSQIQWVRRFRHRWHGKHTSINSQRGHNEEELRKQAESEHQFNFFFGFRNQNVVQFLGPKNGLNFGPSVLNFN